MLQRFRKVKCHQGYIHFNHSVNQTLSPLFKSSNRLCYSANMDENSELAEKAFFLSSQQGHLWRLRRLRHSLKSLLKAPKLTKKTLLMQCFSKIKNWLGVSVSKYFTLLLFAFNCLLIRMFSTLANAVTI